MTNEGLKESKDEMALTSHDRYLFAMKSYAVGLGINLDAACFDSHYSTSFSVLPIIHGLFSPPYLQKTLLTDHHD